MKRTPMPGIYPMPGSYSTAYTNFYLGSADKNAVIHYTMDGSDPDENSPVFDEHKDGSIPMLNFMEQNESGEKEVVIKAFAKSQGKEPSRTAEFRYRFFMQKPGTFRHELLREGSKDTPALYRITDYCRANMFLVIGSKKAMLVDGGIEFAADIVPFIDDLTGGLPVELFVTHGHLDHNGATWAFLRHGLKVYVCEKDIPTYTMGGGKPCPEGTSNIQDGDSYDLGNTRLTAYFLPGHTPGGFVLFDEKTGDLFASDELVNNDPTGPNSLLLGLEDNEEASLEAYCERVVALYEKIKGKVVRIWTGHNTFSHDGEMYFNRLISMMQYVLENGEDVLVPYIRPSDDLNAMAGYGDYKTDFCSFAVSIRYLYREDARNHKTVKHFDFD